MFPGHRPEVFRDLRFGPSSRFGNAGYPESCGCPFGIQPGMTTGYGLQPGLNTGYGLQPGMTTGYGLQPGMRTGYGLQPGMTTGYGLQYAQGHRVLDFDDLTPFPQQVPPNSQAAAAMNAHSPGCPNNARQDLPHDSASAARSLHNPGPRPQFPPNNGQRTAEGLSSATGLHGTSHPANSTNQQNHCLRHPKVKPIVKMRGNKPPCTCPSPRRRHPEQMPTGSPRRPDAFASMRGPTQPHTRQPATGVSARGDGMVYSDGGNTSFQLQAGDLVEEELIRRVSVRRGQERKFWEERL